MDVANMTVEVGLMVREDPVRGTMRFFFKGTPRSFIEYVKTSHGGMIPWLMTADWNPALIVNAVAATDFDRGDGFPPTNDGKRYLRTGTTEENGRYYTGSAQLPSKVLGQGNSKMGSQGDFLRKAKEYVGSGGTVEPFSGTPYTPEDDDWVCVDD